MTRLLNTLLFFLLIPVTLVIGVIFGICAVFSLMYETWCILVKDNSGKKNNKLKLVKLDADK